MRFLFKSDGSFSIYLRYLEAGHILARYQVKIFQLNMSQYILKQKENNLLYLMHMAQIKKPQRKIISSAHFDQL